MMEGPGSRGTRGGYRAFMQQFMHAASPAAATAFFSVFGGDSGSGGIKGLVPAPGAGDAAGGKFLKADGTFAVPAASQLIGTLTTSSGTTQTLSSIAAGYRAFYIDVDGVSTSSTSVNLTVLLSVGGSSFGSSYQISASNGGSGGAVYGGVWIFAVGSSGVSFRQIVPYNSNAGGTATFSTATLTANAEANGALTALRFSWSGGNTFNAGTIRVYGIK